MDIIKSVYERIGILKKYYSDLLEAPMALDTEVLLKDMGLTKIEKSINAAGNVFGRMYLRDDIAEHYDCDKGCVESIQVTAGTMMVDPNVVFFRNIGALNNTIVHITAFVLVFPPLDEEDKYYVLPYFWIPEDNVDLRVRRDHVPYDVWEKQCKLLTTEDNVVHYGYIEQFIDKLNERFNIREIAYDRWGAVQMVQNLEGMGFTVVPFG